MIVEHALLHIKPGQSAAFEAAMKKARPLIAASPGFVSIEVHPAAEAPDTYLLLVKWDSIAAHRDGFRKSERYAEWKVLLHKFYEPMPTITYFADGLDLQ
ncbi:MAG: antibiotic biosynthesis monooxygenase [Aestuariivirga sp.]